MAGPNAQLELTLAHFAAQPGALPQHEAQLRTALSADAEWLVHLNRQALSGQLKGFVLDTSGGSSNLVGTYDKQTGLVTLPAAGFATSGVVPSSDLKAIVGLQATCVEFAHATWRDTAMQTRTVSQEMLFNLQSTLNSSPILAEQVKEAVRQGHLQHFSLMDGRMAAGATYDGEDANPRDQSPKGINLPPESLQARSAANPRGRFDAQDMTFVLGHEIQHGFNDARSDQARADFLKAIDQQARVRHPVHDYSDELRDYIQAGRDDEAAAQVAGWNALLSRERQTQPNVSGMDLMLSTRNSRVSDFVEFDPVTNRAVALTGVTFEANGTLGQTRANIAAMGQHYFDRPSHLYAQPGDRPVGIGEHKPQPSADYPNYYGTWALEQIVAAEDRANVIHAGVRPVIAIDMAGLGLKEDLIEKEGLDLGASKASRQYLDTSQTPATLGRFDHTQDGSVNPLHDHQHVPVVHHPPPAPAPERLSPEQPGHPDHTLLQTLRDGVRRLDTDAGKGWDAFSDRLAASALAMAKANGFSADDDPQLEFNRSTPTLASGELLHLYRRGPGASVDPAANHAVMRTIDALATPVETRYQEAEAAGITRDRTQALQDAQQQRAMQDDMGHALQFGM